MARGRTGEEAAALFLTGRGYELLAANQRTRAGELDLILRRGPQIVVVEVKARGSEDFGTGLEAISPRKARRLRAAAVWWLAERGLFPCQVRFDAVVVTLDSHGSPRSLHHLEDILSGAC